MTKYYTKRIAERRA
jgi:hypothetical protein